MCVKLRKDKERYFQWLCSLVGIRSQPGHSFYFLARDLHGTTFRWSVEGDENRNSDAANLRLEFCDEYGHSMFTDEELDAPATMLEVLVGLSQRMTFAYCGDDRNCEERWFFEMLLNCGAAILEDTIYEEKRCSFMTEEALDRVIERRYDPDGTGGLFPLKHPKEDQRRAELWYQMNQYLIEKSL